MAFSANLRFHEKKTIFLSTFELGPYHWVGKELFSCQPLPRPVGGEGIIFLPTFKLGPDQWVGGRHYFTAHL